MRFGLVMAGGGGTRLWPASRRARPKQLLPLGARSGETLLSATTRRLVPMCGQARTFIVTTADQAAAVWPAVPDVPGQNVIAEPAARSTAAAIGLATVYIQAQDPDAVVAALPADQHIADEAGFARVAEQAYELAEREDAMVTVGVEPTRPETGFGYLELGPEMAPGVFRVARFVEKPDRATASRYAASGNYLWNGGMFFFRASRLLVEIDKHLPETGKALVEIARSLREGGPAAAEQACAHLYPRVPAISIDYGVMEKVETILTVRGNFGWNDVGSWNSLAEYRPADDAGNVAQGLVVTRDARGNVAVADEGKLVALLGVENLVVVQAGNAVLVMPRSRAQDVREIVKLLEQRKLEPYL